jgi:hypothetical protein
LVRVEIVLKVSRIARCDRKKMYIRINSQYSSRICIESFKNKIVDIPQCCNV